MRRPSALGALLAGVLGATLVAGPLSAPATAAVFALLTQLRAQGVPVQAVGAQGHLDTQFPIPTGIVQAAGVAYAAGPADRSPAARPARPQRRRRGRAGRGGPAAAVPLTDRPRRTVPPLAGSSRSSG